MFTRLIALFEKAVFAHRWRVLLLLALVTVFMGYQASKLHMTAGFGKQLPVGHEYTDTFNQYKDVLFGANRLVVVRARKGDIWHPALLKRLNDVTQALIYLPGVDRRTVTSLWTPNTRVLQITEEGFEARDVIGGDMTPERLDDAAVVKIRDNVVQGGYVGKLVANDGSGAMVTADLLDVDPISKVPTDYFELGRRIETELRGKFEDADVEVQIIGFAKAISDIAEGAKSVTLFFAIAFVLTAAAVYWYCRSWKFTFAALSCSLVSLIWQFGTLTLLGYGLDPLAILVPFLVFAIGVSHGVQQVNYISRELCDGASAYRSARASFAGLLVPGTMALVTAFVGFATLMLIDIPMIRELAVTASIGVAYKIITNLVMLPVICSHFSFSSAYPAKLERLRQQRDQRIALLGALVQPKRAMVLTAFGVVLLGVSYWQSLGRHVGYVQPGAPELRDSARYNRDALSIAANFSMGLDVFTIVAETPADGCNDYAKLTFLDELAWEMDNTPGVIGTAALPALLKVGASGFNEGNPKWGALPRDTRSLASFRGLVGEGSGLYDSACTVMPINVYLTDHKAETLKAVVAKADAWRQAHHQDDVKIRLASGNAGVQAATNEVLERTELPMMMYVYVTIMLLVLLTYRDWRAVIACCAPLTVATFMGYWFMKTLDIGLTVATLPVMVLAVGVGVDYAFYIYNRLQMHLADGVAIVPAFRLALVETGNATIFTAITLSVGVTTWCLSPLKFQADMGLLLAFMFMLNMLMAITLLPALAVVTDTLIPRRGPVHRPFMAH